LANKLANALRDRGVQRSETIGLHLPNTPEYLIALVAASKLGCPVTGVSPLLTTPEIEHQLQDAGARFLISMEQVYTTSVAPADGRLSLLRGVFVTSPIGILPKWKQHAAYFSGKLPRPSWKPMIHTATEAFMPAVQNASDAHAYASVAEDETVFIQYTGGTTGKPKGAELTKRNMFANGLQAMSFIGGDSGDTFASAFPLFHQAGLAISLMALRAGARQLLIPNPRDIDFFITQMKNSLQPCSATFLLSTRCCWRNQHFVRLIFRGYVSPFQGLHRLHQKASVSLRSLSVPANFAKSMA
jgi:long-chain acyl-CoA synthetase